jgi:hypothetical protein
MSYIESSNSLFSYFLYWRPTCIFTCFENDFQLVDMKLMEKLKSYWRELTATVLSTWGGFTVPTLITVGSTWGGFKVPKVIAALPFGGGFTIPMVSSMFKVISGTGGGWICSCLKVRVVILKGQSSKRYQIQQENSPNSESFLEEGYYWLRKILTAWGF